VNSVDRSVSWKSVCEEKIRRLVSNGRRLWAHLVELSVDKCSARAAVTRGNEKLKNLHYVKSVAKKRLVETVMD
jgi:hypothetical protein